MLMIWLKKASIVYENGFSAPTPSTVASLNHGGAWENTTASAGFCYLAARQGFLELVRGDRDSRANLMPIYGDLYQTKL